MNFHQLQYILAVDRHRNFARAAEECQIAQSTLSREIQRLEKEFDVLIFDRSRHPVVPTMKGRDLLEQAARILEEEESFRNIALKKDNRPTGSYRLGILSGLAPYLLPLFAQELTEKYPELDLRIFELGPQEMLDYFTADTLDGAIGIAPFQKEGFYELPLFEEEFVLYINEQHPLAKAKEVRWADIPMEELILQEDMKTYFLREKKSLFQQELEEPKLRTVNIQNGSLETIRKIIDLNGGMTLLPQLACIYMGERRLQMVRPIVAPVLSRSINFVTPRGFHKNRLSKVILKEIQERIPPYLKSTH